MYLSFKLTSIVFQYFEQEKKEIILILLKSLSQLPVTKMHSNSGKTKQNKNNEEKHFTLTFPFYG